MMMLPPPPPTPIAALSIAALVFALIKEGGFFNAAAVGTNFEPPSFSPIVGLKRARPDASNASSIDEAATFLVKDAAPPDAAPPARETSGDAARASRSAASAAATASFNPPVDTASVRAAARTCAPVDPPYLDGERGAPRDGERGVETGSTTGRGGIEKEEGADESAEIPRSGVDVLLDDMARAGGIDSARGASVMSGGSELEEPEMERGRVTEIFTGGGFPLPA